LFSHAVNGQKDSIEMIRSFFEEKIVEIKIEEDVGCFGNGNVSLYLVNKDSNFTDIEQVRLSLANFFKDDIKLISKLESFRISKTDVEDYVDFNSACSDENGQLIPELTERMKRFELRFNKVTESEFKNSLKTQRFIENSTTDIYIDI
jgi:hypothetical protein